MSFLNKIKTRWLLFKRNKHLFALVAEKGGKIDKTTKVYYGGDILFGRNLIINGEGIDNTTRSQIYVLPGATLEIGEDVGMSQVSITCKKSIKIGDNVKIGAGTMIFDTNFHSTDWQIRRNKNEDLRQSVNESVVIEDDVFIGARSIICKGVTIGARSIIAAGSVVVKDIPSDCIAGGNPCRVIKNNESF